MTATAARTLLVAPGHPTRGVPVVEDDGEPAGFGCRAEPAIGPA
jgi:hypothetical protein